MRHFVNAPVEIRWLDPQTADGPIGHLDFFRSRFRDTLWPGPATWLKGEETPDAQTRSPFFTR